MPNTSDLLLLNYSLTSVTSNALTGNATILLQGLMQSWGWRDLSGDVHAAEEKQQALEQRLKMALQHYLEEPDTHHKDQLVAALKATRQSVQAEYDHALQQQAHYQAQAESETKQAASLGYVAQWQDWAFQGVKSFFGSATEQLVEKYGAVASKRRALSVQLSDCIQALQARNVASLDPEWAPPEDRIDMAFAHSSQRRLLSTTTPTPTLFPAVIPLAGLNGQNGFKIDGEVANDASGFSVSAAGDINGDGYADLIIGAYQHASSTGRSYVVFGGLVVGSSGVLALSSLNGINGFKLDGEASNDQSGISVSAVGDINGDGYADLLIGAAEHVSGTGIGRSYVVFGGPGVGRSGVLALSSLNGTNGFKLDGEASNNGGGISVSAAGDINGDGHADLIIGAVQYASQTGRSYVVFGGSGVGSSGLLALSSLNGTNGFKLDGEASQDLSSYSVSAAGDINGDGHADLLIGAWNHASSTGRSYVVFGGPGVGSSGVLALSSLNGTNGFKLDGEAWNQSYDYSGYSVSAAGDINGDGHADLIIGAAGHAIWTGRSYVVFGGSGVGSSGILALSSLNGINGFKLDGEVSYDGSGYSVSAAGDINGDGHADLLIGAPQHASYTGRSYVVLGGPGVGSSGILALSSLNGTNGFKLDGEASNDQSGRPVSAAGDINGDSYADLIIGAYQHTNETGRSYVVFGDTSPQIWENHLTIHSGETLLLTANNLNATGTVTVTFTVYNAQHGYFQLLPNPGQIITQFNQLQILNGQIQFIHDGSQLAPGYTIQATSRIAITTLQAANITFYRRLTILNNQLLINQGQKLSMTSNFLSVMDDYPASQVNFTISNLQHGQFQLAPLNTSVAQFTWQQLLNNQLFFIQDNTASAPSYHVGIKDPYFTLPPAAAMVTFYQKPTLISSNLTISQGQKLTLSSSFLNLVNEDYPANQVNITISNLKHGQISLSPSNTVVAHFTLQELQNGQVIFTQDSSPIAPSALVSISDSYFIVAPQAINVTFALLPPAIIHNQLTTLQGRSTTLTLQNLQGSDPDQSFNLNTLIFSMSQIQHGQFSLASAPSRPIVQFSQGEISAGQVVFIQDGNASAPSYAVVLSDGWLSTAPQVANISFDAAPVFINNRLAVTQGASVLLSVVNLGASDDNTPAGSLLFTVSKVQHGYFAQVQLPNTLITQFSQAEIGNSAIEFVSDGTNLAPAYAVTVTDSVSLSTGPQDAQVTFFTTGQSSLSITRNTLTALQGRTVTLGPQDISVQDTSAGAAPNFIYTVSNVQHGQFSLSSQLNTTVAQFTQSQLNSSLVLFTQDGTRIAPSYDLAVSDGALSTVPQPATLVFIQAPILINNRLTLGPGDTVVLAPADILATDDFSPDSGLDYTISNLAHGYFEIVSTSQVISTFTQEDVDVSKVAFVQDGSSIAPAYSLTVTDGAGLSTGPSPVQVTFNLPVSSGSGSSNTVRNAIIGGVISGVLSLLFLGLQMWVKRRAEKYFEQATIDAEGGHVKKQADFHKQVVRPVTKRVLERIKVAGAFSYISQETARDTISAIVVIIHELEKQGVEMDMSQLSSSEQSRLVDLISRQTQRVLVPDAKCCSPVWTARFFCPETTPALMEASAGEIAAQVKKTWDGQTAKGMDESALTVKEHKASIELQLPASSLPLTLDSQSHDDGLASSDKLLSPSLNPQRTSSQGSFSSSVVDDTLSQTGLFSTLEKKRSQTTSPTIIEKLDTIADLQEGPSGMLSLGASSNTGS